MGRETIAAMEAHGVRVDVMPPPIGHPNREVPESAIDEQLRTHNP